MGVVAKQSIKGLIYSYFGAIIGFVNAGLLMPKFLSQEQVGLVSLLLAISLIFSNFTGLGFSNVLSRLFPYFRDDSKNHNGILPLAYLVTLVGSILTLIIFFILRPYLIESNMDKSDLFADHVFYVPILFVLTAFYTITDVYNKSLFDATLGIFLKEFFIRVLNLLLIIIFVFNIINFEEFLFLYVLIYISPLFIMVVILLYRNSFQLSFFNWGMLTSYKKEMILLSIFGLIAGFSSTVVFNIDTYMINHYIGLEKTGIYAVSFYFGVVILIPSRALKRITSIVIAEAWKDNDLKLIDTLYKKSTVTQLIIALLIFIGIWANIHNIFKILPDYKEGMYVILLIGGAYVIEMLTGVNDMIFVTSKYYKTYSYIMLIKIVFVVIFNIILIPIYGLTGGALASFATILITSILRYVFLILKFKLQPYNTTHLMIILLGAVTLSASFLIPVIDNLVVDIILRSSIITVVYSLIVFFAGFSEDINTWVLNNLKKLGF